jgi:hypothetical protein
MDAGKRYEILNLFAGSNKKVYSWLNISNHTINPVL